MNLAGSSPGPAKRFALVFFGGIKGVGNAAADHLIEVRENSGTYQSLYDVCERIDTRAVNKRVIEHLTKVGALDSLHANRQALCETIDRAFDRAHRVQKAKREAQATLFGAFEQEDSFRAATQGYVEVSDWDETERLAFEKALTGYWMSSHPLVEHQERLGPYATHTSRELADRPRGQITLAAVVVGLREVKTRAGKRMAVLQLEDMHGRFEAVLFPGRNNRRGEFEPGAFERFAAECEEDLVALFTGQVDDRDRNKGKGSAPAPTDHDDDEVAAPAEEVEEQPDRLPSLLVEDVVPSDLLEERLTREITVEIDASQGGADERIAKTEALVKEHTGPCPLRFLVQTDVDVLLTVQVGDRWRVHPTKELITGLKKLWGDDNIVTSNQNGSATGRLSTLCGIVISPCTSPTITRQSRGRGRGRSGSRVTELGRNDRTPPVPRCANRLCSSYLSAADRGYSHVPLPASDRSAWLPATMAARAFHNRHWSSPQ